MLARATHVVTLEEPDDFEAWRAEARRLLAAAVPPDRVVWQLAGDTGELPMGEEGSSPPDGQAAAIHVPRHFIDQARLAICHRDPARFSLCYRLLWRLRSKRGLIDNATDADVHRLRALARNVKRDIHKMRAFLRFRTAPDGDRLVAWFEPGHHILRANAAFFVNRFTTLAWSILTPIGSLHWDGETLREGPPATRDMAPADDPTEALWREYYASIFNPARLKLGAMLKEMPRRYWKNMPETALVDGLIAGARGREIAMVAAGQTLFEEAPPKSLRAIADGIRDCRRCAIGCNGTLAVAGEGGKVPLMMVGEQPGDQEERQGHPFVGPAGQVLREFLDEAGIDLRRAYLTNAVKHFKFEPRGKRRLHQNPTAGEIDICRWWLDAERKLVRPKLIVTLGASAARGILGRTPSIQKERGEAIRLDEETLLWMTVHPSYLLRLPDEAKEIEKDKFRADLAGARKLLDKLAH